MSTIIKPTVGRKVWYRPSDYDRMNMAAINDQPLDATVVCVWSDQCVNLAIFDANGSLHSRTSVYLMQDGAPLPHPGTAHAEWMPYQQKAAARDPALDIAAEAHAHMLPIDRRPAQD